VHNDRNGKEQDERGRKEQEVNRIIGTYTYALEQEDTYDTYGHGVVKDRDRDRDRNGNRDKDRNKDNART
jgi:hypothetical protein